MCVKGEEAKPEESEQKTEQTESTEEQKPGIKLTKSDSYTTNNV
jgi:hypothetical protein